MIFRKLQASELAEAISILVENKLPTTDFTENTQLFGLFDENQLIGTGGLEDFGGSVLMRSIAVRTEKRGKGYGAWIVSQLEDFCFENQIGGLFLITDSAASFFEKTGFRAIERSAAPAAILKSKQFSSICPSAATAMEKDLTAIRRLLFVCIENSNRSQMAQAFANIHGKGLVKGYSAGSRPSGKVNPKAVAAMLDLGYDLGQHFSKSVADAERFAPFEAVVTMGCGDACPWVPTKKHLDWAIPDPRNMEMPEFFEVRDLVGRQVKALIDG